MSNISEVEIQQYWSNNNVFQKSIDNNSNNNQYIFYDGPPFATGLPHYGHILAGFIKDSIGRFQTQKGYSVPRNAGWDCHGLPIEYEIEKQHNIKTRQEIENWGIGNYNNACKNIVLTYTSEWETTMNRLGRWVDFKNDYKTMDFKYMDSVWSVFGKIARKGMVYSSYRVMPYSIACKTPLSNFETQQNYQLVDDITVYVKFKFRNNINILVWTSTPWTLPSNICLAINKNIEYVLIKSVKDNELYIIAKNLLNVFETAKIEYTIVDTIDCKNLLGQTYEPLFDSYPTSNINNPFTIIHADYITDTDGTGIVHIAPSYGDEDYKACLNNNIIMKDDELYMSIDDQGYFIDSLHDIGGLFYKNMDKKDKKDGNTIILMKLKQDKKIFLQKNIKHNYPFCWRSDTPLMFRAVKTWFINVEMIKNRMVELNKQINWIPENIGSGRFHQWLVQARDWCIGRNRYWGTPIPIWQCSNGTLGCDPLDYIVIESAKQLEEYANLPKGTITDLHRDKIDHITFTLNGKTYKRITEIFDCWFESGAMPYASNYCGDNNFPADFIAEGLDQTRGWFYTLLVISTAVHDSIPFKNVIVNGLVLASDGKKMSKRLKNYPCPMEIVNKYGSDALRLYLLGSVATRGEPLKFNETSVYNQLKDIIIPLQNSLNFYIEYKQKYEYEYKTELGELNGSDVITNPLDCFAITYVFGQLNLIKTDIGNYLLSDAVKRIYNFVEILNNQYIKFNRYYFKGKESESGMKISLRILGKILEYMSCILASLMPYTAEYIWQKLFNDGKSVHLVHFSDIWLYNLTDNVINKASDMKYILNIIKQVQSLRSKNNISMSKPLETLIIRTESSIIPIITKYSSFILEELNVLNIDVNEFKLQDIDIDLKPNYIKIKSSFPELVSTISSLMSTLINDNNLKYNLVQGLKLDNGMDTECFNVIIKPKEIKNHLCQYSYVDGQNYVLYLNQTVSLELEYMTFARLIATQFKKMRKNCGLHVWDVVELAWSGESKYDLDNKICVDVINKICNTRLIKLLDDIEQYNDKIVYKEQYDNMILYILK
jgi:isoleucyl-tRNA synthetase